MEKYGLQRGVCGLEARHTPPPNITVIFCTLHRREAHWRVAQGAVRQVLQLYGKSLIQF